MAPADSTQSPTKALTGQNVAFWSLLLLLFGIGIALRSAHMTDIQTRTPDEYTYTWYAGTLLDRGISGYVEVFKTYTSNREFWEHPSPTRLAGVLLTTAVMDVSGVRNARAGAAVSWASGILSLFLVAAIGLRFFSRPVALLGLAFLSFSFAELSMARRAWQDSQVGFLGLVMFFLTCEILRAPRRKTLYVAFFSAAVLSLLSKEANWIAFAVCGAFLFLMTVQRERSLRVPAALAAGAALSVAVALGILALFAGGIHNAISAEVHVLNGRVDSPYVFQYSGPWYQFLYLLWLVGPLTAAMAATGIAVAAFSRHPAAILAALITLTFVGISCFGYRLQCLRLISPADGPCCLLAALALWQISSLAVRTGVPQLAANIILSGGLAWAAVRDYRLFVHVSVNAGIEDLAVRMIRTVMAQ